MYTRTRTRKQMDNTFCITYTRENTLLGCFQNGKYHIVKHNTLIPQEEHVVFAITTCCVNYLMLIEVNYYQLSLTETDLICAY